MSTAAVKRSADEMNEEDPSLLASKRGKDPEAPEAAQPETPAAPTSTETNGNGTGTSNKPAAAPAAAPTTAAGAAPAAPAPTGVPTKLKVPLGFGRDAKTGGASLWKSAAAAATTATAAGGSVFGNSAPKLTGSLWGASSSASAPKPAAGTTATTTPSSNPFAFATATLGSSGFGSQATGFGSFGGGPKKDEKKKTEESGEPKNKKEKKDEEDGSEDDGSEGSGESEDEGEGKGDKATAATGGNKLVFGSFKPSPVFGAKSVSMDKATEELARDAEVMKNKPVLGSREDTGEEDEYHVSKIRAKLYQFVKEGKEKKEGEEGEGAKKKDEGDAKAGEGAEGGKKGDWQQRGVGDLTLNEHKTDRNKSRLVMRVDGSKRLVLNAPIWAGAKPTRVSDMSLQVTVINHAGDDKSQTGALGVYLIRGVKVAPKDVDTLFNAVTTRVAAAEKSTKAAAPATSAQ